MKETQQVSGQQIVEEAFHPIVTGSSPVLRGLTAGFPQLLGYNGTTIKPAAQQVLVTARDDPLLAQWQYGLGRAVAWTSDASGRWAKAWVGWDGFARFFSQLVAWTFPGEESGGIEASFEPAGTGSVLHVQSVGADGTPRDFYATSAMLVGPDLRSVKVDLSQTAPGIYEAPLGTLDPGAYAIRITQTRAGAAALGRTLGLVAPTAAEYRQLGTNEALLATLRAATGGTTVATPSEAWRHDLARTSSFTDLWPFLLVLAMLLWPLDVALRRVSVGRRELAAARAWPGARWRAWRAGRMTRAPGMLGSLLAARARAGGAGSRSALLPLREDAAREGGVPVDSTPDVVKSSDDGASQTAWVETPPGAERPTGEALSGAAGGTPAAPMVPPGSPGEADPADVLARLREAKRRARGDR